MSTTKKNAPTAKKSRRRRTIEPSRSYMEVLKVLERGDLPTPKQLQDLFILDHVVGFAQARFQDLLVYRFKKHGRLPRRLAWDDAFSIGLEAAWAEMCAEIEAKQRAFEEREAAQMREILARRRGWLAAEA